MQAPIYPRINNSSLLSVSVSGYYRKTADPKAWWPLAVHIAGGRVPCWGSVGMVSALLSTPESRSAWDSDCVSAILVEGKAQAEAECLACKEPCVLWEGGKVWEGGGRMGWMCPGNTWDVREFSCQRSLQPFSSCLYPKLEGSTFSAHSPLFKRAVSADPTGF